MEKESVHWEHDDANVIKVSVCYTLIIMGLIIMCERTNIQILEPF